MRVYCAQSRLSKTQTWQPDGPNVSWLPSVCRISPSQVGCALLSGLIASASLSAATPHNPELLVLPLTLWPFPPSLSLHMMPLPLWPAQSFLNLATPPHLKGSITCHLL